MILYSERTERLDVEKTLRRLREALDAQPRVTHELSTELVIDFGELEAGISDALCPDADTELPTLRALRSVAVALGHLFHATWRGWPYPDERWPDEVRRALQRLEPFTLPAAVTVGVPEGYAYYGLYPEAYLEATTECLRQLRPQRAVCLGVRSIGTSLSAIATATLEELGCDVFSSTVRPRGHPLDRNALFTPALESRLRERAGSPALIVDEGPGLSGSSMTSIAGRLAELGFDDADIVMLPSCNPDPFQFLSANAKARWARHRKFISTFEDTWIASGRLEVAAPGVAAIDISAGRWRHIPEIGGDDIAVQPQHERRKYLIPTHDDNQDDGGVRRFQQREACRDPRQTPHTHTGPWTLAKFAGLGRYGRSKWPRACELADEGFCPQPISLKQGFLTSTFVRGTPATKADLGDDLLDRMVRYLAFVNRKFPAGTPVTCGLLMAMLRTNVREGLGEEWLAQVDGFERLRSVLESASTVAVDGRLLPHEWIRNPENGFIKTDALDHHSDHFFPGCQDIAWDVAGAAVEFSMPAGTVACFTDRFAREAPDPGIRKRLPFYLAAYCAYRLAYAARASEVLAGSPDGRRFESLAATYATRLREALMNAEC
jgi:hypothetical protein